MATQYLLISFPWIDFRDNLRLVCPPAIIRIRMTQSAVPVWSSQVPICRNNIPVDLHGKWLSAYCLMVCSVTVSITSSCSGATFAAKQHDTSHPVSYWKRVDICKFLIVMWWAKHEIWPSVLQSFFGFLFYCHRCRISSVCLLLLCVCVWGGLSVFSSSCADNPPSGGH